MSFAEGSHAKISATPAVVRDWLESAPDSGRTSCGSSPLLVRYSQSWKMFLPFALGDWGKCYKTSIRSGMTQNGIVYPLPPLAPHIIATGSGLLPTPRACDGHK